MYESMTYLQNEGDAMRTSKLSMIQEKGQVTIPAYMRRKLGLKKGDMVAFIETEEGILISPQEVIALDSLRKIGESLRSQGVTLEELMEGGRQTRGALLKEMYGVDQDVDQARHTPSASSTSSTAQGSQGDEVITASVAGKVAEEAKAQER